MGTRYINAGRTEERVDTTTDIIGDTAQQQIREVFAPRIAKLTKNALNVMPFPFELFQRVRTGRRCSCFGVEDDAAAQCVNCWGSGVVGAYLKRGTRLWVLDVTSNNVRAVNVAPDYRRMTRPTGFSLVDTAVYGYLETEIPLGQNIGIVDALNVYATHKENNFVEPYIKSATDTDWVPLTTASLQVRLGFRTLGLRIVFRRQGPQDPLPSLAGIRISYTVMPNSTVRVDLPRVTESRTLEDFGYYESWSSQSFFLDGEVRSITTDDFFYSVMDGTRWKCIEVKSNVIAGTNTSWDLVCRLVQTYEPIQGVPVGIVVPPSMRPPKADISAFVAPGSPDAKAAAQSPFTASNASENTLWRQDAATYVTSPLGPTSNQVQQSDLDSERNGS